MKTSKMALIGLAITALSVGALLAQPSGGGQGGPGGGGQGGPGGPGGGGQGGPGGPGGGHAGATSRPHQEGGFHLIPPFAAEKMKLTDDQKKQLEELAKETKAKLEKILTPDQMKILHEARPPHPMGGQGGRGGRGGSGSGQGGPGGGAPGGQGTSGGRPAAE